MASRKEKDFFARAEYFLIKLALLILLLLSLAKWLRSELSHFGQ
jgi:hypothetical protein